MSIHYFGICEFAVVLRVIPKLTNNKADEIRQKFIDDNTNPNFPGKHIPNMTDKDREFHHFENSMREAVSGDVRMLDGKWNIRIRDVSFNGESVILMMGDKNGAMNKRPIIPIYPANAHAYLVDMMRDPSGKIWNDNKESKPPKFLKESLLDDIESRSFDDTKSVLHDKAVDELGENPEDMEYYIHLKVRSVKPSWNTNTTSVNVRHLFDELTDATESSAIIPQRYFITYPHLYDDIAVRNRHNDGTDVQFTDPLPEDFDLKEYYGQDYWNASPFFEVCIYINSLTFFEYPRFVREMNRMLGRFHQAIKCALPQSKDADGEMMLYYSNPEDHDGRQVLQRHCMYTKRCFANGEYYRSIYKWMFPDAEAILPQAKDYDVETAAFNIRKLDVVRLGRNLESLAPEYGFEAEVLHTYRGIPSDNTPVPLSWIAVDLKSVSLEQDEKNRMDVRTAESLFIDAVFRHITEDMVTHTHFFIFVRSHFDIYNKELEEKKARGWKVRQTYFDADVYKYDNGIQSESMSYINQDADARPHIVDIHVREIERWHTILGRLIFFDEKGKLGRKPFRRRPYHFGGEALEFIDDVVQSGLIWKPDFKMI